MSVWEILLIGIALSMDAFAVGMSDGMTEPKQGACKTLAIAGAFALFQFGMPLMGYALGSAFAELVGKIAPWLSFALLGFLGGKTLLDSALSSYRERKERQLRPMLMESGGKLTAGKLLVQAVATSLDALAVGVTLLAAEASTGLPFHVAVCSLVIGCITFALSLIAVHIGKIAGVKFSKQAEILGGGILVVIGMKILLEGIL